ncbi:hypothetical protein Back2_17990 [Nocardioides baekrokdamisoli]|uniref:Uncharacterized protein n=1 Tax=Nocardioides baekrokdamisoli TaxID=1804624 RepID=A0A3G9IH36_9ACTN|nr:baseplate J/gp47 family protein [Nocardioides baekrokdamisoli]BBH17512.1 hypothetical protein Back2_17990 [Nocardioides baekrokdamisoli]
MSFQPPQLETDEDAVTARILDGLATRLPGWVAIEGAPEVALAEELGREIANLNQATALVIDTAAAAGLGQTAFQFPAYTGATATIAAEVTVASIGVIIPAGFTVIGTNLNGDEVAFVLPADVAATSVTMPVTMNALVPGDVGNGVPIGSLEILSANTNIAAVDATAASSNGADAEDVNTYLGRLVDYLSALRPGGVNGADLAALARTVPGVHRALGVDLYDPAAPTTPTERTVTVFPIDTAGRPVSSPIATQVQAVIEGAREVNFIVHVADPEYTAVHIAFAIVAETGADTSLVHTEVIAALSKWLSQWGVTSSDDQAWVATNTVRFTDAIRVAGAVAGVAYISSLTVNGSTADLVLAGVAALPAPLDDPTAPSTVTGTVS